METEAKEARTKAVSLANPYSNHMKMEALEPGELLFVKIPRTLRNKSQWQWEKKAKAHNYCVLIGKMCLTYQYQVIRKVWLLFVLSSQGNPIVLYYNVSTTPKTSKQPSVMYTHMATVYTPKEFNQWFKSTLYHECSGEVPSSFKG